MKVCPKIVLVFFVFMAQCPISTSAQILEKEFAKSGRESGKAKRTIITGVYLDTTTIVILGKSDFTRIVEYEELLKQNDTTLAKDGKFKFILNLDHPIFVTINNSPSNFSSFNGVNASRNYTRGFLVEPGDSIYVKAKQSIIDWSGYEFSGLGSTKILCEIAIIQNTKIFDYPAMSFENARRFGLVDSLNDMIVKTIDIYKSKLSPIAIDVIKAKLIPMLSFDISELLVNPDAGYDLKSISSQKLYYERIKATARFFDISSPGIIYCQDFIDRIVMKRAIVEYLFKTKQIFQPGFKFEYFKAMYTNIPESPLKTRVIGLYLSDALRRLSVKNTPSLDSAVNYFLSVTSKSNQFRGDVVTIYNKYNDGNITTDQAFAFSLPDTLGYTHKLEDFKGQVVLLDFMYNGCPGCRALTPYMEKVEKKYRNNSKMKFVSISVDQDIDTWKGGIGKSSVSGSLQLYTNGQGYKHPIIDYYKVFSYPTLVLVGKDGNIITRRVPDPRLDDGKLMMEMIDAHLNN